MPIVRQTKVLTDGMTPSSADFTVYTYPFDGFPLLKSHLHPRFAIFEAGRRLESLQPNDYQRLLVDFPSLALIGNVYEAWSRKPPEEWKKDESYNVQDGDDDDDDDDEHDGDGDPDYDDQTSIGRSFGRKRPAQSSPTPQTKRQRPNPRPSGSKRKVLSELTMANYHRQPIGKTTWTADRIFDWSLRRRG